MTYLPMLCTSSTQASGRAGANFEQLMSTGDWLADVKIDGVRVLAHWDGSSIRLTNRVDTDVTARFPEVVDSLAKALRGLDPLVLDGEVIAKDGSFETTLTRDKQSNPATIARMVDSHPVMLIAFDLPEQPGTYAKRRAGLEVLANTCGIEVTITSDSPDFLAQTRALGLEGVVAKRLTSRYEAGRRSPNWIKFRNRFRVTCLVAGYAPGTGSRSHFGAMELALLDGDGSPVSVGRVGTGFTEHEITTLKQRLDAGELLTVEIECANQTSGRTLRFPVYKGIRSDVSPLDCSIEQLNFLPTC